MKDSSFAPSRSRIQPKLMGRIRRAWASPTILPLPYGLIADLQLLSVRIHGAAVRPEPHLASKHSCKWSSSLPIAVTFAVQFRGHSTPLFLTLFLFPGLKRGRVASHLFSNCKPFLQETRFPEPVVCFQKFLADRCYFVGSETGVDTVLLRPLHLETSKHLPNRDTMKATLSVVLSLVLGPVLYLLSRLYKVRKEMEKLVREHIHVAPLEDVLKSSPSHRHRGRRSCLGIFQSQPTVNSTFRQRLILMLGADTSKRSSNLATYFISTCGLLARDGSSSRIPMLCRSG
jgi:hypothetical protein